MKVFDLFCGQGHVFEGWFGSEEDYQNQQSRQLIECPMCGAKDVQKRLSAPRLNLGAVPPQNLSPVQAGAADASPQELTPEQQLRALQSAWLQVSRKIMQDTEDVGARFADEARRMHRGEVQERGIRGQASREEALELIDEGIDVMPLLLPVSSKETLQ